MAMSDERSDDLIVTPMPQLQTADSSVLPTLTFIMNPPCSACSVLGNQHAPPLLEQQRVRLGAEHAQFWLRQQAVRDAANSCADTLQAATNRLGYELTLTLREGGRRLHAQELKREGGAQVSAAVYALLATPPFLGAETKAL